MNTIMNRLADCFLAPLYRAVLFASWLAVFTAQSAYAEQCTGEVELWFMNDESLSVTDDEFADAKFFIDSVAGSFAFNDTTGFRGALVGWDTTPTLVTGLTASFPPAYPRPAGGSTNPGAAMSYVASAITDYDNSDYKKDGGAATRDGVPSVVVLLTDANGLNGSRGPIGDPNLLTSASKILRDAGHEIVIMLAAEAADRYTNAPGNGEATFKTLIDATAGGASNVIVGSSYADLANPTKGHISNLSNRACAVAKEIAPPTAAPELTITKTADATSLPTAVVGDVISYTITVENTGNVDVTSVSLTDALTTDEAWSASDAGDRNGNGTLNVGETWTYTASYALQQSDLDEGSVENVASVTASPVTGGSVTAYSGTDGVASIASEAPAPNGGVVTSVTGAVQLVAEPDRSFGNNIGAVVTVSVLDNDSYGGNVAVELVGPTDDEGRLNVAGEGVWNVGDENIVQFSPARSFVGDPTPIEYVITAPNVANSNKAKVYVDYLGVEAPDGLFAADDELAGQSPDSPVTVSPLDNDNRNGDGDLVRSTLRLLDPDNNKVEELTVENVGTWKVNTSAGTVTFTPAQGFSGSSVNVNYYIENASGTPQTATIKILFIDPRGVVYNSETGAPVSGVVLQFADASGTPLPTSCLADGQQPQRTGSDGRYRFDLSTACTDLDGEEFQILITDTPGYALEPDSDALQAGPLDPGTPNTETFEVVSYDAAPTASQARLYYMSFTIGVNSRQIVNNHIPLTPLVSLIDDDLREVLRDDLAATMMQQSQRMEGYASSALRRLQEQSSEECELAINNLLAREPILFETGSANIRQPSLVTIDRIAAVLAGCDEFTFEVGGHTDDVADEAFNLNLSQARASAVVSALHQRGVPLDGLNAKGFGESQPIVDNGTEDGRRLNRRVEFVALGRPSQNDECDNASETVRGIDATINQNGISASGEFWRETRDCQRDGWNIIEGSLSYLRTDQGMAQSMANLSYRSERFRTKDHLAGQFVGAYATSNDVTGLATGTIQGFGLNAGLYGARHYETGLYLDYYLGAAAGRHNFDLDFARTGGVVTADGFYTYVAAFAGAAVSGEMMLGDYKLMPRAGLQGAWSPGGDAEFEASRGAIEQSDSLSTGEVVGLRVFVEQRFDDVLPESSDMLAITPMLFCDRPIGAIQNACGAGLSVDFSYEDDVTGERFGIELSGEKTRSSEMFGLQFHYGRPVLGGELSGTSSVTRNGQVSIGANYTLDF